MQNSKIAWTQKTWNPITGCSHVSEGCRFCYAESFSRRFNLTQSEWTHANASQNVRIRENKFDSPKHIKKPSLIFVNSMSDLFHPAIPDAVIFRLLAVMRDCSWHTFQVLTKRPENALRFFSKYQTSPTQIALDHDTIKLPLPNVWLGVSVEDQRSADLRIPLLTQLRVTRRFISF